MNAVNLIPVERRRGGAVGAPGVPFLGLLVGLIVVLAATYVYVDARDRVASRQVQLTQVQASVSRWTTAAERYSQDVAFAAHRTKGIADVRALVADRYDWSLLLGQLARVTPARAQLSSLTAATDGTSSQSASAGSSGSSGIQLTGCASSQTTVAATMVALRQIIGISQVSLLQSGSQGSGGSGAGSCRFAVQFQLSIVFDPPVGQPTAVHPSQATGSEAADTTSASNGGAS